jgi:hypothetical protein
MTLTSSYIRGVLAAAILPAVLWSAAPAPSPASLRIREFVVMGYQGLMQELATSTRGPYLRTLNQLLQVKPDDVAKIEHTLQKLSVAYPNIMDFADQVATLQKSSVTPNPALPTAAAPAAALPTGPHVYSGDRLDDGLQHLTKGMAVTVYTQWGEKVEGQAVDYSANRLLIRTPGEPSHRTFQRGEIRAIDAPGL